MNNGLIYHPRFGLNPVSDIVHSSSDPMYLRVTLTEERVYDPDPDYVPPPSYTPQTIELLVNVTGGWWLQDAKWPQIFYGDEQEGDAEGDPAYDGSEWFYGTALSTASLYYHADSTGFWIDPEYPPEGNLYFHNSGAAGWGMWLTYKYPQVSQFQYYTSKYAGGTPLTGTFIDQKATADSYGEWGPIQYPISRVWWDEWEKRDYQYRIEWNVSSATDIRWFRYVHDLLHVPEETRFPHHKYDEEAELWTEWVPLPETEIIGAFWSSLVDGPAHPEHPYPPHQYMRLTGIRNIDTDVVVNLTNKETIGGTEYYVATLAAPNRYNRFAGVWDYQRVEQTFTLKTVIDGVDTGFCLRWRRVETEYEPYYFADYRHPGERLTGCTYAETQIAAYDDETIEVSVNQTMPDGMQWRWVIDGTPEDEYILGDVSSIKKMITANHTVVFEMESYSGI